MTILEATSKEEEEEVVERGIPQDETLEPIANVTDEEIALHKRHNHGVVRQVSMAPKGPRAATFKRRKDHAVRILSV
jgi:hypothetical protein